MQKLYQKSEIWFAILWIAAYVVGTSASDVLSAQTGVEKSLTLGFHILMTVVALCWINRHGLWRKYGLCRTSVPAKQFLSYLPLVLLSTVNLWFGFRERFPLWETVCSAGSMLCVGFLEELIFRGFLFRAMEKENRNVAILVSSLTFGIGHIVNLINGSGADLLSNLCQVCYAVAFGFLFVILFCRGGSLWPCILAHSGMNTLSVFADGSRMTGTVEILVSVFLCVGAIGYAIVLQKRLPELEGQKE